ncbi:hypothetical protein ACTA71_010559 [Dictyostelium dimigraforme]
MKLEISTISLSFKLTPPLAIITYNNRNSVFEKKSKNQSDDFEKAKRQVQKKNKVINKEVVNDQIKEYSLGETLFWKVWKNKYLLRTIINFLKTELKVGVYSFEEIVSVQWMLQNNYIELLKYKAKRGDLLVDFFNFKVDLQGISNNQPIQNKKLKNLYKEIRNDFQFYKDLFKNYPLYFNKTYYGYECNQSHMVDSKFGPRHPRNIKEYTYRESIVNDNVAPFSLLEYENVNIFYEAIEFGSVNIAKYLFNTKLKPQKNDIIGKVWKNHTFINLASNQNQKDHNIINKIVKLLIVDLKLIPPKEMNKVCEDFFHVDIKSLMVSELYECCFTIALLLEQTQFFKEYLYQISKGIVRDKYMDFNGYLQNYLPNPSIDFLTTNQLDEMKSNHRFPNQTNGICSKVISISKDDQLVYKLIKMLLPFTNYSKCYKDNFFYFNFKYVNNGLLNFKVINKTIHSKEENLKTINYIELKDFNIGNPVIENVIFENQQLISSNIYNFQSFESFQDFINNPIIIKPKNLILILLGLNRLDLLIQALDNLLHCIPKEKLFPPNLLNSIKSIEIFDYLLNIKSLKDEFSFETCLEQQGLNLMEHIKTNHNDLYFEFLNSINPISEILINYSFNSLMFIYKNIKDFHHCYDRIDIWKRWNYFSLTLNDFIQLVGYTPIDKKYSYHCGTIGDDDLVLKRLDWVKKNRAFDLLSGRCDRKYGNNLGFETETQIHIYNYHLGDLKQLKTFKLPNDIDQSRNISIGDYFSKIFNIIGSRDDVKALEIIMEILDNQTISSNYYYDFLYESVLTPIMVQAVINCKFKIFNFLKLNYHWIFDDCLINTKEIIDLNRYSHISILYGHLNKIAIENSNLPLIQLLRSNYFNEIVTRKKH